MISTVYIIERLEQGRTIPELATELEITPRHVRRLAKAGGWTPAPRRHTGPRTLRVSVSAETYQALSARGGASVEATAAALLALVADKNKLDAERRAADQGGRDGDRGGWWAAGYLDALVAGIERVR